MLNTWRYRAITKNSTNNNRPKVDSKNIQVISFLVEICAEDINSNNESHTNTEYIRVLKNTINKASEKTSVLIATKLFKKFVNKGAKHFVLFKKQRI